MRGERKRRTRLVVALSAALLLAGALAWTSFTASSQAVTPSALAQARGSGSYELTGTVLPGYRREGRTLVFRVRDRTGTSSVQVRYTGEVPDPFRDGREVIVTVRRDHGAWIGERDSLITKCPSKFVAD
jgi:cytochrome c-type biogenesis protein CcmE